MGVGDYVQSKEAVQLRHPMKDAPNHQSRQDLAEQARVEVPAMNLLAPVPPSTSRQPEHQGQHTPAENAVQKDMFDTDVEGIDDSTVAATSVMGGDDVPYQFSLAANTQHYSAELKPLHKFRQSRRSYNSKWYENLGDKALKTAGFDSEDMEDGSQLSSMAGDDDDSDNTKTNHSPKRRGAEVPLSKRLQNFWSASRKTYPKTTSPVHDQPVKPAAFAPSASDIRGTNPAVPISGPRKITLPHSKSATPRTRFSPPKPSLLDQLDLTPTRSASGPRPQPSQKPGVSGTNPEETGDDEGVFSFDYGRRGSMQSMNRFDVTNLDALDEDAVNDPFSRHDSVRRISPDSALQRKRHLEPDYPPEVLRQKSFSELQAEPFDHTPAAAATAATSESQIPEDKMSYLMDISEEERHNYFSNLTLEEWEECGDLMIEEFSKMLNQMKELRRARRKTAAIYEAEIKRRHEAVEEQASELNKKLDDMRTGGAEVLRAQTP
ncbi:uncharacterized protein ATNIH1004_003283 [Aspergillus tanneri]|nr:uncharacterized protein ATNIH1004_003283 [Aspergillus tanneri]KAA8650596.1 hypothetical protein ATNIH1004_003283 [Aspergillus tanneri]